MNDPRRCALPETCDALLAQMVAHPTVNPHFGGSVGGQAALVDYLRHVAVAWGLDARLCPVEGGEANLVLTCEVEAGAPWRLFESHLDTVGTEGMTIDPFRLAFRDGRLHGRGACDTKGSGAAMLWALRDYARQPDGRRNVAVVFTVDEEARMSGARAFAEGALRGFLPTLEGMVVGEPTRLRPVTAHNGVVRWKTITRGVAAHSSVPAKGQSAISGMRVVLAALEDDYARTANRSHALTGNAAFSVNVIRGGSQVNVVPAHCEIECDRRLVPGEQASEALAERDRCLAGCAVEHSDLYVVPPFDDARPPRFLGDLQRVLQAHGQDPALQGAAYVTNASHYSAAGAPVIVLGPGDIAQAHTADEWIGNDQLMLAVDIYRDLMTR